ncbi:LptF/LptG family permease [Saccharospirillum mangrovi]|uniref:LptF/LptG family permease n=1 Tax=Saccharospirillum mangrovi TaxID=2161747 RepID=UPI000D36F8C9|nr:LptF/LptG family permease [Saccharospirillum mangrovi]
MLSILNAYIVRRTALFISIVVLAIGGLLLIMGIADELSRRASENYGVWDALIYKLSGLPSEIYQYIGPMVLLGTLISVAGMAKNNELVIVQLASTSAVALLFRLMLPGLILLPLVFCIGEWVGPQLRQQAELVRAIKLDRQLPTLSGEWYQDNQWIINVDFVSPERDIRGLTVFEMSSENDLLTVLYAPQARPINQGWELLEGRRVDFKDQQVIHSDFDRYLWQPDNFNADLLGLLSQRSYRLTLPQVWQQMQFSQQQRQVDPELALAFWNRMWFPIIYLGMLFLALIFSFGSFRQRTLGDAAFKGVALAIAIQLVTETSASLLLVVGLSAPYAALLPPMVFFIGTVLAIRHRL